MSSPDNNTNISGSSYTKIIIGDGEGPVPEVNLNGDGPLIKGDIIGREVTVERKVVDAKIKVDMSDPNWLEKLKKSMGDKN